MGYYILVHTTVQAAGFSIDASKFLRDIEDRGNVRKGMY